MDTEQEMELKMLDLAEEFEVEPTENLPKIAKVRVKLGLPITVCPCAKNDTDRGCISAKCFTEIVENGTCHCRAFKKKGE